MNIDDVRRVVIAGDGVLTLLGAYLTYTYLTALLDKTLEHRPDG